MIKSCVSLLLVLLFLGFPACNSFDSDYDEEYYDEEYYDEYMSLEPETVRYVEDELTLNLKDAEVEFNYDDHGGFLGDGEKVVILDFHMEDTIESQLESNLEWDSFPLPDSLEYVLYGDENGESHFTKGETSKPVLPEIKNGYWYFYDRHMDSVRHKDESEFLTRTSYNYTVAVYDSDEDVLYYFEYDT